MDSASKRGGGRMPEGKGRLVPRQLGGKKGKPIGEKGFGQAGWSVVGEWRWGWWILGLERWPVG